MSVYSNETFHPSSLVKFAHDLPHWTYKFHKVHNTSGADLDFTDKEYIESLAMLGVIAGLAGAVFFVLAMFYACCCRSKRSFYSLNGHSRGSYSKKLLIFCSVVFFLMCAGMISSNIFLDKSIKSTLSKVDDIENYVDARRFEASSISSAASQSAAYALQLQDKFTGNCSTAAAKINQNMKSLYTNIDNVANDIPDIDNSDTKEAEDANHYRSIAAYSLAGLFLVVCLVSTLSRPNGCITFIYGTIYVLLWIIIAVYIAFTVGIADVCYNPTPLALNNIADSEYAPYYFYCTSEYKFPFRADFMAARMGMAAIAPAVGQLEQCHSTEEEKKLVDFIMQSYSNFNQSLPTLEDNLYCPNVHNMYITGVKDTCDDGFQYIFSLTCVSLVAGLFSIFSLFLIIHRFNNQHEYDDNDEAIPLLDNSRRSTRQSTGPRRMSGGTDNYPYSSASSRTPTRSSRGRDSPEFSFSRTVNSEPPQYGSWPRNG